MIERHGNVEWAAKFCVTSGKEGNMSRIGKTPIEIKSGVEVVVNANSVEIKGPKGTLAQNIPEGIEVQKEEETILDSEIDEFDIEEMTEKFRKWMISNRDRFLVDFENPKGKLKQDEKTFHLRFHDDYSFKIVLEN